MEEVASGFQTVTTHDSVPLLSAGKDKEVASGLVQTVTPQEDPAIGDLCLSVSVL